MRSEALVDLLCMLRVPFPAEKRRSDDHREASEAKNKKVIVVGALAGAAVAVVAARALRRAMRALVERSADREIAQILCAGPVKVIAKLR